MKRLSDRFAEAAISCNTSGDLRLLLEAAVKELGFHYFALVDHSSLGEAGAKSLRIDNYPESWVHELIACGYARADPVHLACRRENRGFSWSEIGRLIRLQSRHAKILSRSHYHGLGAGFTIPSNVPGEPSASCSFAVRAGQDLPLRRLDCAELVGAHALSAARRLRANGPRQPPKLSRREVECLRFIAMGKSDWEIAMILGLSVETTRQYVKSARAAYDAVSRTQLVVYALRDSWISFDDAIPPNEGMA